MLQKGVFRTLDENAITCVDGNAHTIPLKVAVENIHLIIPDLIGGGSGYKKTPFFFEFSLCLS
jgi:hypothetical protein